MQLNIIDVLLGKTNERIRRFEHDRVSTFGIGTELSEKEWKSVFRQLVAAGLLSIGIDSKGGFRLSPKCRPVLKGEQVFKLRQDPISVPRKKSDSPKYKRADLPPDADSGDLWEKLRSLRRELASQQSIPAFIIFHDSTLREMVQLLPQTLEEMRQISGIGERKLELYGEQFLSLIREHLQDRSRKGEQG